MPSAKTIDAHEFYREYHGHTIPHLERLHESLRGVYPAARRLWLVGDSSLDNKYWFSERAPATPGYAEVLRPPSMVMDIAYWLNRLAADRLGPGELLTVNCAIEESTVAARASGLLPQDAFVRDHVGEEDTVVVSVGGNDVVLAPTPATAINMLLLTRSPRWLISSGWAPGMSHFERLFRERTLDIVRKARARTGTSPRRNAADHTRPMHSDR